MGFQIVFLYAQNELTVIASVSMRAQHAQIYVQIATLVSYCAARSAYPQNPLPRHVEVLMEKIDLR